MAEFCTKTLVENAKTYLQTTRQIKQAGYNQYLGGIRDRAKNKVEEQIRLYEAQKSQKSLKLD